jgi:hypothetical protein
MLACSDPDDSPFFSPNHDRQIFSLSPCAFYLAPCLSVYLAFTFHFAIPDSRCAMPLAPSTFPFHLDAFLYIFPPNIASRMPNVLQPSRSYQRSSCEKEALQQLKKSSL